MNWYKRHEVITAWLFYTALFGAGFLISRLMKVEVEIGLIIAVVAVVSFTLAACPSNSFRQL